MKIAIIGSTGLLGSNLLHNYLKLGYDVKGFSRSIAKNVNSKYNHLINFQNLENDLDRNFTSWKPDLIINTIAIVNLQQCEDDYDLAYNTNVSIAKNLSMYSKKMDSYFIHVSTDHYYNDSLIKHREIHPTVLLNNYAKTKYQAEKEVIVSNKLALIVRTNIIGFRNTNTESFFEWLLSSLKAKQDIKLFSNMYTSPIAVKQLTDLLIKCYKSNLSGIYNIASSEVISKFDFGMKTIKLFEFDSNNISKVNYQNDSNLQRALTLGLNVLKIENALNTKMPTIDEVLKNLYLEYKDKYE